MGEGYRVRDVALLISFFILSISKTFATESLGAPDVFKKYSALIFHVETSATSDLNKQSYGTGFVIDKSGLLLTNYHVVNYAVMSGADKIFVNVDGKKIESFVIAIDAVDDLALVLVPQTFENQIELAEQTPEDGALIFSLGFPKDLNASVVQGNYNGLVKSGPYERLQVSTPLNPGMSGGPSFDGQGRIIGINVAILTGAQNISFLVPVSRAISFLAEHKKSRRVITKAWAFKEMRNQIKRAQKKLYDDWQATTGITQMDGWRFRKSMAASKCWSMHDPEKHSRIQVQAERCQTYGRTNIFKGLESGYFDREIMTRSSDEVDLFGFYSKMQSELAKDYSPFWGGMTSSEDDRSPLSKFHCNTSAVHNSKGIPFAIAHCSRANVFFPDLFDTVVRVATRIPESKMLTAELIFSGFEQDSIDKMVQAEIEAIEN
jgi:serine protease Do